MSRIEITAILLVILFWTILSLCKLLFNFIPPDLPIKLILGIVGSILALLTTFLFLKFEKKKFSDIGFRLSFGSITRFSLGTILGIVILALVIVLLLLLTPLKLDLVVSPSFLSVFAFSGLVMFLMAYMEEVIFRGYPLLKLQGVIGVRGAIYITSLIFGLYHGITVQSLIGPAVWGLAYGLMAFWSKGIALPTGFHFGINWAQGIVGMKTEYVKPLWEMSVGESDAIFSIESVGLSFQIVLFVVAVLSIEYYLKNVHHKTLTR